MVYCNTIFLVCQRVFLIFLKFFNKKSGVSNLCSLETPHVLLDCVFLCKGKHGNAATLILTGARNRIGITDIACRYQLRRKQFIYFSGILLQTDDVQIIGKDLLDQSITRICDAGVRSPFSVVEREDIVR